METGAGFRTDNEIEKEPEPEIPKTYLDYFRKEGLKYTCTVCPDAKTFTKTTSFKHSQSAKHSKLVNYKKYIEEPSEPVKEALEQTLSDMNMSRYGRKVIKSRAFSTPTQPKKARKKADTNVGEKGGKPSADTEVFEAVDGPKQREVVKNPFLKGKPDKPVDKVRLVFTFYIMLS